MSGCLLSILAVFMVVLLPLIIVVLIEVITQHQLASKRKKENSIRVVKYADGSYQVQNYIITYSGRGMWSDGITRRAYSKEEVKQNIKKTKEWLEGCRAKERKVCRAHTVIKETVVYERNN